MLAAAWGDADPSPPLMTEDEQRKRGGGKKRAAPDAPVFLCFLKILLIPSSFTKAEQRIPFIRWSVFYL